MEAFAKYPSTEWVWWLDVDAIIMTPHLDLYDYLLKPEALRTRLIAGEVIKPTDDVGINHDLLKTGEVHPSWFFANFKGIGSFGN
jgi:hypothetical protein